jgi:hypothetical protein
MAINPSKLLRLKPIRATITASSLRGLSAPVKPKITASQISSSSVVANKQVLEIQNSLVEIVNILKAQNKFLKDTSEKTRKTEEAKRRADVEENLEKRTGVLSKAAEKILSPVKSLLDKIIDFILAVFIGRALIKLIRWFSDPQNKTKIRSLFRFLGDHWPKLLALYLRFGTGLGRFIGGLSSLLIRGTLRIAQAAAGLAARAGLKGAGKVAGFLGGRYGKALAVGLEVGTTVAGTMALSKGIENFAGLNNIDTKVPKFAGGGLARFKNLFGFFGGGPGHVSGQKGVDKIPAMLSDGEFVMSRGAVQKYGVGTLEAMNAAGGGTNRPKIVNGTAYAAGGGFLSFNPLEKLLRIGSSTPREGERYGPPVPPFDSRAYTSALTSSASKLMNQQWSYASQGGDPRVGCAPAINEVYRKAGLSIPWSSVKRINYVPDIYQSLSKSFVKITEPKRNPGDIVIWKDSGYPAGSGKDPYGHIGIVMPGGKIANNSSTKGTFTNLNTPNDARSWWPHTKELLYFRHPKVHQSLIGEKQTKPEKNQPSSQSRQSRSSPSILQRLASVFMPPARADGARFSGGPAPNTTSRPSTPMVISASTAKSRNASKTSVSPPMNFMPEVVYEVEQPRQKVATGASGNPRVPSFSVSYAGGNAEKNATIYGIG